MSQNEGIFLLYGIDVQFPICLLKPNTCNNKARRIKFHRYVCQFLPMSDFSGIAQKVKTFSNSCAQNRHDLLAKIGKHIDGTSSAERGCNTDWTLTNK